MATKTKATKLTKVQQMQKDAEDAVRAENDKVKVGLLMDIERKIQAAQTTVNKLQLRKQAILADLEASESE
jgi:hypothetical protein